MGKFTIKQSGAGFSFNLKANNGEIIAAASEVYTTKGSCENGVESVRKNAPIAPVEDQTVEGFATEKNPKFEIYTAKASCKNGIESVRKNAPDAELVCEEE